ncbi:MAG: DNA primase [Ruminococcaceae bacterium]|nr:DNA primase [Oscillospiraceae bacterium]
MEIKYKNPIDDVISSYVNLKRAGRNLNGLCPFHNEKTPSFTVYTDTSSFYCFGCGAGGDVFGFIRKIENLDYIEAVKKLADRAGVTIPEGDYDDSYLKLKNKIYEINKEAAKFFHNHLFTPEGKWALDYLTGRGLDIKTIKHFGLGCAPNEWDGLLKHLKSKGFYLTDMEQANVITKGKNNGYYDRFRNRVMFPIIEINGKVVGFSGRRHPNEDKGGKYVNTSDTPVYKKSKTLFGFNFAKNHCAKQLLVVEGNMDVVSLHKAGFENTIGTLGTAFTSEQARMISRYTNEIVLGFDSDAAGQKAVARASEVLGDSGLKVRVLSVPDGKDPDEFIKKNGPERFKAVLEGAVNEIEYKLFMAAQGIDTSTADGKAKYLNLAAEALATINSPITIDLYAGRLAEQYGITKATLIKEAEKIRYNNRKIRHKKEIGAIIKPVYKNNEVNPLKRTNKLAVLAEETIIAVIMAHPDSLSKYQALIEENMISDINKRIFKAVEQSISGALGKFDISLFGDEFSPEEMGYISSLQNSKGPFVDPQKSIDDAISVLQKEKINSSPSEAGKLDDDAWAKQMEELIKNKKRSN